MAKDEKLINRFQREPLPKDIDFDDLSRYLSYFGIQVIRVRSSHHIATHPKFSRPFPIPTINGRKVKSKYLKLLNQLIKEIEE